MVALSWRTAPSRSFTASANNGVTNKDNASATELPSDFMRANVAPAERTGKQNEGRSLASGIAVGGRAVSACRHDNRWIALELEAALASLLVQGRGFGLPEVDYGPRGRC
ncbi:hypothetical protein LBMAG56_13970 [Verrucomicrobiota bacterium]|nr:hypothetical protein LBMAG56_13970 [Verrucomicrobiota bacterium]